MTESATSDWLKGGMRYAKLKDVIPQHLAPERVEGFFCRGCREKRISPAHEPSFSASARVCSRDYG